jgi:acetyltransferase
VTRPEPQHVFEGRSPATKSGLRARLARGEVFIRGKDGQDYRVRPIEPSDAPSLIRGFNALSPRERWFRFLHAAPELSETAAKQFCSPDPVLDICLVIEGQGALAGDIVGGARITGSPGGTDGEFSVSMRPEMQGLGLARQALQTVLDAAAEAGYRRIWGYVAAKNDGMRKLAKRLGFTMRRDPDDFSQLIAEIRLMPPVVRAAAQPSSRVSRPSVRSSGLPS